MRHLKSAQMVRSSDPVAIASFTLTLFLAAFVLMCCFSSPGIAHAGSRAGQPHIARLSHVDGSVQVLRGDQTQFEQAVANMPLVEGSRLQTGQDGRAEVQFDNGSIARLTPNSALNLNQIQRGLEGAAATQIEMLSGLGYFELRSRGGEDSLVFGPNTITPLEGSATIRMDADAKPAELSVLDGKVHVTGGTLFAVDVQSSETIRFDAADPARYYLAQGVNTESWDQWNSDRDQVLSTQALKKTQASETAVNSNNPGWGDLDQNGGWYSVPGYGNMWSPYGVGASWDPYGSGYWGYYPGSGYTWISGYSWGWLPYRCGNWNYVDSFGWGWSPNNCGMNGMGMNSGFFNSGGGFFNSGGGGGVFILNRPRGYRPPPRPHPVHDIASTPGSPSRLIRVDRGQEASQIVQQPQGSQQSKAVVVNGVVLHPLPPRPANPSVGEAGMRPSGPSLGTPNSLAPGQQGPRSGGSSLHAPYNGAQRISPSTHEMNSMPAQRNGAAAPRQPTVSAPAQSSRPSAPSAAPTRSAPMQQSSPSYSAPSMSRSSGSSNSAPSRK